MKYIRLLFYILFISKTIVTWGGENIGGLSFHAYEYSKDERTSFIIPSGNQGVRFKDYLSVSFDLKIREKGEHFGYVCRMIVDNRNSLNLILVNPVNEEPYLCLINNKMGFSSELDGDFFSNGNYDIFDALPNNVLVGNDGHLYFIDTIIYKSQDNGFEKYKSLSPRYNQ